MRAIIMGFKDDFIPSGYWCPICMEHYDVRYDETLEVVRSGVVDIEPGCEYDTAMEKEKIIKARIGIKRPVALSRIAGTRKT